MPRHVVIAGYYGHNNMGDEAILTSIVTRLRTFDADVSVTVASASWRVTEDGLFQFGHSQDQRPDLPQFKIMLATLDPFGLPVAAEVVAGQRADDPLYLPAIARAQRVGPVWAALRR